MINEPEEAPALASSPVRAVLVELAHYLNSVGYHFVSVTPETHRRNLLRRHGAQADSLRDVFGWNMRFARGLIPGHLQARLENAHVLVGEGLLSRSAVRFSTLDGIAYLHSGYPTFQLDAVFFGPDTYRFVALIEQEMRGGADDLRRVLDVGCGGGAGGLMAARIFARTGAPAPRVELADINARALAMARINAESMGVSDVEFRLGDLYQGTASGLDLIVSNPPYLLDQEERTYRHGGGDRGFDLSLRIVKEGLPLLAPGGRLVLYTGVPVVGGRDLFREAVEPWMSKEGFLARYRELDPDVFGEELERAVYADVERIAVVSLVIQRIAKPGEKSCAS